MSNERDELRGTLANTVCNVSNFTRRAQPYLLGSDMSDVLDKTADAILAAGYRKPRTISTAEELDALPVGAMILDSDPDALRKVEGGGWLSLHDHDGIPYGSQFITFPATVLRTPEPTQ